MSSITAVGTPTTVTNREFFVNKANQLVLDTTRIALATLISHSRTSARDFYNRVIEPKQNEINGLDERTKAFFQKMMPPVTQGFSALNMFDESFSTYEGILDVPNMKARYLEAVALNPIKNLMTELDERSPTIVDDVIES